MKKIILSAIAIAAATYVSAQPTSRSTYFMEGYNLRHQLNPAFAPSSSYFSIPLLNAIGTEMQSNLGVSTFLYPVDGKLTTFMNSSVSAEKFLGNLKQNNQLAATNNFSVLAFGIRSKKAFWSFDVNLRTESGFSLPYDLFDFMKNAGKSQSYDISGLSARAGSRLDFALGHSHNITERLRVGGKVKLLVGLANIEAVIDRMDIRMTEDRWSVMSEGTLKSSAPAGIKTKGESGAKIDSPSDSDLLDFGSIETDAGSLPNGFGAAIDFGAEMEIIDGFKVSLAINDLGYMSWKNTIVAKTSGDGWSFDGFDDISLDGGDDNSLNKQIDDLTDDLMDMFDFRRTGTGETHGKMVAATVNAGAEYVMPFYKGLSAGILSSTYINGTYTWTEGRLSVNAEPVRWFSTGVSYAVSKFGSSVGAVIGFHTSGFNLFISTDHLLLKYAKLSSAGGIYPYGKLNTSVNFGLSFNIGKRI